MQEGDIPNPCPNNNICYGIGDHEDEYECCPNDQRCTTDDQGFPICISEEQWLNGRLFVHSYIKDPNVGNLIGSFIL